MAGLCAARVLSGFYDKVTVIDRDAYPVGAHERPGVPQSRHVHALLMRGRIELDRLFPGFEQYDDRTRRDRYKFRPRLRRAARGRMGRAASE